VERAKGQEQAAWDALVDRLAGLVWSVIHSYGISEHDAVDIGQMTWLQLVRGLGRVREPERVGLWLATTARRECLRFIYQRSRSFSVDPATAFESNISESEPVEDVALGRQSGRELWEALESMPTACRSLISAFLVTPEPSYAEVAAGLGIPLGSIGPRRQRCLAKLRAMLD
jgi:RNA polymerase sigma factor (sigma-70 family)